ncbi:MAG: 7-cyano-7-deazaguanine synthase [Chloroflexi bacterium]|nr:7-cyano-7-deazaguanine synthase [Chloroflexota bacterium]
MITDPQALDPGTSRAVLLYSGGFDSTLVALLLKQRRIPTVALAINYPTRPAQEARAAEVSAQHLGFEEQVSFDLALGDFRHNPESWPSAQHEAWFPYRNVTFFGIAAHFAIRHRCNIVAAGIRFWDDFDDASDAYFTQLEQVLQFAGSEGFSGKLSLFLPLIMDHDQATQAILGGGEVEQLLRGTWSCWRSGPEPCGQCSPCRARNAFLAKLDAKRAR